MPAQRVQQEMQDAAINALTAGDTDGCRRWSMRLLHRSRERGDTASQAHASLLLARSQWAESNPAAAYQWSETAERLAVRSHDATLSAAALDLQSCSASALGWADLAVSSSERSLALRSESSTGIEAVNALNYRAVAYSWRRQVDTAQGCFQETLDIATESRAGELLFQPLVNRCILSLLELRWCEDESEEEARAKARERLLGDVRACQKLLRVGAIGAVNLGMENMMLLAHFAVQAYAHLLSGHPEDADEYLQACRARGLRFKRRHWVQAFVHWTEHECARHAKQDGYAQAAAKSMEWVAGGGGHRPLQLFARELQAGFPSGRAEA